MQCLQTQILVNARSYFFGCNMHAGQRHFPLQLGSDSDSDDGSGQAGSCQQAGRLQTAACIWRLECVAAAPEDPTAMAEEPPSARAQEEPQLPAAVGEAMVAAVTVSVDRIDACEAAQPELVHAIRDADGLQAADAEKQEEETKVVSL